MNNSGIQSKIANFSSNSKSNSKSLQVPSQGAWKEQVRIRGKNLAGLCLSGEIFPRAKLFSKGEAVNEAVLLKEEQHILLKGE
jgi:hypothetical protein